MNLTYTNVSGECTRIYKITVYRSSVSDMGVKVAILLEGRATLRAGAKKKSTAFHLALLQFPNSPPGVRKLYSYRRLAHPLAVYDTNGVGKLK